MVLVIPAIAALLAKSAAGVAAASGVAKGATLTAKGATSAILKGGAKGSGILATGKKKKKKGSSNPGIDQGILDAGQSSFKDFTK